MLRLAGAVRGSAATRQCLSSAVLASTRAWSSAAIPSAAVAATQPHSACASSAAAMRGSSFRALHVGRALQARGSDGEGKDGPSDALDVPEGRDMERRSPRAKNAGRFQQSHPEERREQLIAAAKKNNPNWDKLEPLKRAELLSDEARALLVEDFDDRAEERLASNWEGPDIQAFRPDLEGPQAAEEYQDEEEEEQEAREDRERMLVRDLGFKPLGGGPTAAQIQKESSRSPWSKEPKVSAAPDVQAIEPTLTRREQTQHEKDRTELRAREAKRLDKLRLKRGRAIVGQGPPLTEKEDLDLYQADARDRTLYAFAFAKAARLRKSGDKAGAAALLEKAQKLMLPSRSKVPDKHALVAEIDSAMEHGKMPEEDLELLDNIQAEDQAMRLKEGLERWSDEDGGNEALPKRVTEATEEEEWDSYLDERTQRDTDLRGNFPEDVDLDEDLFTEEEEARMQLLEQEGRGDEAKAFRLQRFRNALTTAKRGRADELRYMTAEAYFDQEHEGVEFEEFSPAKEEIDELAEEADDEERRRAGLPPKGKEQISAKMESEMDEEGEEDYEPVRDTPSEAALRAKLLDNDLKEEDPSPIDGLPHRLGDEDYYTPSAEETPMDELLAHRKQMREWWLGYSKNPDWTPDRYPEEAVEAAEGPDVIEKGAKFSGTDRVAERLAGIDDRTLDRLEEPNNGFDPHQDEPEETRLPDGPQVQVIDERDPREIGEEWAGYVVRRKPMPQDPMRLDWAHYDPDSDPNFESGFDQDPTKEVSDDEFEKTGEVEELAGPKPWSPNMKPKPGSEEEEIAHLDDYNNDHYLPEDERQNHPFDPMERDNPENWIKTQLGDTKRLGVDDEPRTFITVKAEFAVPGKQDKDRSYLVGSDRKPPTQFEGVEWYTWEREWDDMRDNGLTPSPEEIREHLAQVFGLPRPAELKMNPPLLPKPVESFHGARLDGAGNPLPYIEESLLKTEAEWKAWRVKQRNPKTWFQEARLQYKKKMHVTRVAYLSEYRRVKALHDANIQAKWDQQMQKRKERQARKAEHDRQMEAKQWKLYDIFAARRQRKRQIRRFNRQSKDFKRRRLMLHQLNYLLKEREQHWLQPMVDHATGKIVSDSPNLTDQIFERQEPLTGFWPKPQMDDERERRDEIRRRQTLASLI